MSMRRPGWFSPLFVLFPAIMVAALVLGYLSYRAALELAEKTQDSVERSNRALGLKLIDRLEKVIIDTDRVFFSLVRLDDPREFRELWRRIVRVSAAVESVVVLNDALEVEHLVAKLAPRSLRDFRRVFMKRILPDLGLDELPPNNHMHLHKEYNGKSYLLSFIRRRSEERDYYIVLSVNIPYLINDAFPQEFHELEETSIITVTDEHRRPLYGRTMDPPPQLRFSASFPTTLYKWKLRIAPRHAGVLTSEVKARRLSDLMLVGGAVGVIWIGMIVMMIAIRKERRANELKSEFIANVSHELKTPLSLIRMFAELLALGRTKNQDTSREYAEIITRESDRLTGLIDNVLDFARIERGKAAYEMTRGDLQAVVERAVELCRYRVEQADVQLVLALDEHLPQTVFDESALTLVVLNLVENALKYGVTSGGGMIWVALTQDSAQGALVIRVSDDGPGIAPDEERRIFERFYRGQEAREGSHRGSGIGLSLVKHIATAHGGTVTLESELGKGATFAVFIPLRETINGLQVSIG
ncbi:MAG: HAMP domain-containing histidine kinase [Deltaproteobacteria bacterium]|nr:HAMP domain-containing histidine kinase [Deltaproteobacteria bacterium]